MFTSGDENFRFGCKMLPPVVRIWSTRCKIFRKCDNFPVKSNIFRLCTRFWVQNFQNTKKTRWFHAKPPPFFRGVDNKGGFSVLRSGSDGAAGENFEVLASFFIDFPLEIVF